MQRTWKDEEGQEQVDRRQPRGRQRNLPSWVDYTVVSGVIGLIFTTGIQYNKIEDMHTRIDALQNQMTILVSSDSKAKIAVIEEHQHAKDQELSDLKDTILRRFDRLDAKIDGSRK